VVKGLGKLGLGRRVTAEAEIGLLLDQQCFRLGGMVRGVAVKTTDIIRGMSGGCKPALFVFLSMTARQRVFCSERVNLSKRTILADIAAAGNVLGRGSVARFATVTATPGGLEVRGGLKVLVDDFVAGLACVHSSVFNGAGSCRRRFRFAAAAGARPEAMPGSSIPTDDHNTADNGLVPSHCAFSCSTPGLGLSHVPLRKPNV